jgi:hypothetical protein
MTLAIHPVTDPNIRHPETNRTFASDELNSRALAPKHPQPSHPIYTALACTV